MQQKKEHEGTSHWATPPPKLRILHSGVPLVQSIQRVLAVHNKT